MTRAHLLLYSVPVLQLLWSADVQAFPEMVRRGYVNCTSCHVSPSGGGLLTEYGRELSREELSSAGSENESKPFYGLAPLPKWLNAGGDLRALFLFRDTPSFREGKAILMQADVEAGATYEKMSFVGTAGYRETSQSRPNDSHFISRRHYLLYRPMDELTFRGGKFNAAYGINTPDHATAIKRGLGWDQGSETYNFEGSYITDKLNFFVTGIFGRPDDPTLNRESGASAQFSYSPVDNAKLGLSYFYGMNPLSARHVAGVFALAGLASTLALLSEVDFQFSTPVGSSISKNGFVNYQKLDFEFLRGFHAFITQELSVLDFSNHSNDYQAYSVGLQVFPRPHLEASLTYQRLLTSGATEGTDLLFLLLHFYL